MRIPAILLIAPVLAVSLAAQSVGPDVTVSSLTDVGGYGQNAAMTISAFAVGTTACNVGNQPVNWISGNNQHPVIAQNMYQYLNGRFQQIGMSWLKHGFASTNSSGCGSCVQPPGGSSQLGVGCTDSYGSGLNGGQGYLGPRSAVNPSTGSYPYPHSSPTGDATIAGRLQVLNTDLGNGSAQYFVEAQYVTADDALAGNKNNNATWQKINTPGVGAGSATFNGAVHPQQPAIYAWQSIDAAVVITTVDVANDGRFLIARKVTSLGGGNYHYEFAVHNLNSDRAGAGFTVNFAPGTVVTSAGFRSIPYHSGEPFPNTAWTATISPASINWNVGTTFQATPNANALRWGTMDNFWCDATAASETTKTIDLFKPPPCPADPVVPAASGYTLNTAATFDNPTLLTPSAGPSGDDVSLNVPIGFSFNFYGTSYTTVNICTNGFLSFASAITDYTSLPLPTGSPPAMIAVYWDDLITPPGSIVYKTLGAAPNRRFVVHWNGVGHYSSTGTIESFKVILDETTNKITSTIVSSGGGGAGATRGIQNQTGTTATQASASVAGSAVAGTSQTYTPYSAILPSATLTVTGSTGANGVLTWSINSNARSSPVVLIATLDPGPTNLGGNLGIMNIGLTPGLYYVVADGLGAFQPANPADFTDWYCGDYSTSLPLGPNGLPPGMTIYNQGVVINNTSTPPPPNGQFHITTEVTITT